MLSETWLNETHIIKIPNYNIIRSDRPPSKHGGLAIIIKNNIIYQKVNSIFHINNKLETLAISIPLTNNYNDQFNSLLLVSLYRVPSTVTSSNEWNNLFNSTSQYKVSIIGGDFNAHHHVWGAQKSCPSGDKLVDSLTDYRYTILNDNTHTHFNDSNNTSSTIDLTLLTTNTINNYSWNVLEDRMTSDHAPIVCSIHLDIPRIPLSSTHRLNSKNINWKLYNAMLDNFISKNCENISQLNPDMKYKSLINLVTTTILFLNKAPKYPHNNTSNITKKTTPFINLTDNPFNDLDNIINKEINKDVKKIFKSHPIKAPWWDDECSTLCHERRIASRNFMKNPSAENLQQLKLIESKTKNRLRIIKKNKFRQFVENKISPDTDTKTIWNTIKAFKNIVNYKPSFPPNDLELITNSNNFVKDFCPDSLSDPVPNPNLVPNYSATQNLNSNINSKSSFLDDSFTLNELKIAIDANNRSSAPGLDQIDNQMLKNAPDSYLNILLETINYYFQNQLFHESWKNFLIVLIPKNQHSFRPIALASCMLKLTERLLNTRLQHYLEQNNIIPNTQYGFRKNKSCDQALAHLLSDIHNATINNKHTCAVMIDIKSAFDHVCPQILNDILLKIKIPIKTRSFIFNLISNRHLFFKIAHNISGPHIKNFGVPQGCVLSPLLYNIYVHEMNSIIPQNVNLLQYADDSVIYTADDDINHSIQKLESTLYAISNHLQYLKLTIHPEKTKLIIFAKIPFNSLEHYSITFNNITIFPSQTVKYLGLFLDYQLKWDPQAEFVINKSYKLLNILKMLRGTWWGGHPSILLNIYTTVMRSILEYGSFLMYYSNSKFRNKIQIIQNHAIRLSLGFRGSSPINVIHSESKTPPLKYRIQLLSEKFALKLIPFKNSPLFIKLDSLNKNLQISDKHNIQTHFPLIKAFKKLIQLTDSYLQPSDTPIQFQYNYTDLIYSPDIDTLTGKTIKKSDNPAIKFDSIYSHILTNEYTIFTDASKDNKSPYNGIALYAPTSKEKHQYRTTSYASIFTSEAIGIYMAINLIKTRNITKATIFTDSLSVLEAIKHFSPIKSKQPSHWTLDIKKLLFECNQQNLDISLVWIPSHLNIKYNEIVDNLAKEAINNGTNIICFLPPSDFFEETKSNISKSTTQMLIDQGQYKGVYYFNHFYKPTPKPWFTKLNMQRYHITTIIRLRSNHYNLAASLHRKNYIDSPNCQCGHILQNIDHILWDCPTYDSNRRSLILKLSYYYNKNKKTFEKNTSIILREPNLPPTKFITEFLKKCNLQI